MTLEDQVVHAIASVMRTDAEIIRVPGHNEINVMVSWKLNDDPCRPNKMSKTIRIMVSKEAAQDFANVPPPHRSAAIRRLSQFLEQRLVQFSPHHDAPQHEAPPVEQWIVDSGVLFG